MSFLDSSYDDEFKRSVNAKHDALPGATHRKGLKVPTPISSSWATSDDYQRMFLFSSQNQPPRQVLLVVANCESEINCKQTVHADRNIN